MFSTMARKSDGTPDVSSSDFDLKAAPISSPTGSLLHSSFTPATIHLKSDCMLETVVISPLRISCHNDISNMEGFTIVQDDRKIFFVHLPVEKKSVLEYHLKWSILALLDLADATLDCDRLVICIAKNLKNISNIVHGFSYVGFDALVEPERAQGCEEFIFLQYIIE